MDFRSTRSLRLRYRSAVVTSALWHDRANERRVEPISDPWQQMSRVVAEDEGMGID